MTIFNADITKYCADGREEITHTECISEWQLSISLNGTALYRLICTAENIKELVIGRLYSDGFIISAKNVDITMSDDGHSAEVTADNISDGQYSLMECDTINAPSPSRSLKKMKKNIPDRDTVFYLAGMFRNDDKLHKKTSSTHRCLLYDRRTSEHFAFEDISRHNAVDKAIGYAVSNGFDTESIILFASGRVPSDMAVKVISAGIPVLITKSSPTKQAIELADRYGLTLICRAWNDSYEVFTYTQ